MKFSGLSRYKIEKILNHFCIDLPAAKTAQILQINRNTINLHYGRSRKTIFEETTLQSEQEKGEFYLDVAIFQLHKMRVDRFYEAIQLLPR